MNDVSLNMVVLAFLGMLMHIIVKISERNKVNNKFSIKKFFSDDKNVLRLIIAIISMVAVLLMSNEISDVLGITLSDGKPANGIIAFLGGFLNHSIIRSILKVFGK